MCIRDSPSPLPSPSLCPQNGAERRVPRFSLGGRCSDPSAPRVDVVVCDANLNLRLTLPNAVGC
eukprot:71286-Alexandrium_andersonii.AAC.1